MLFLTIKNLLIHLLPYSIWGFKICFILFDCDFVGMCGNFYIEFFFFNITHILLWLYCVDRAFFLINFWCILSEFTYFHQCASIIPFTYASCFSMASQTTIQMLFFFIGFHCWLIPSYNSCESILSHPRTLSCRDLLHCIQVYSPWCLLCHSLSSWSRIKHTCLFYCSTIHIISFDSSMSKTLHAKNQL